MGSSGPGLLVLKIGITELTARLRSTLQDLEFKSTKVVSRGTKDEKNSVFLQLCSKQELNQICTQLFFIQHKAQIFTCSAASSPKNLRSGHGKGAANPRGPRRAIPTWIQRWKLQRRFPQVLCKYSVGNKAALMTGYANEPSCELQQFRITSLLPFSSRLQVISGRGAGKAAGSFSMWPSCPGGLPRALMPQTARRELPVRVIIWIYCLASQRIIACTQYL